MFSAQILHQTFSINPCGLFSLDLAMAFSVTVSFQDFFFCDNQNVFPDNRRNDNIHYYPHPVWYFPENLVLRSNFVIKLAINLSVTIIRWTRFISITYIVVTFGGKEFVYILDIRMFFGILIFLNINWLYKRLQVFLSRYFIIIWSSAIRWIVASEVIVIISDLRFQQCRRLVIFSRKNIHYYLLISYYSSYLHHHYALLRINNQ